MTDSLSVGIVMLTYNAAELLPKSLPPLLKMQPKSQILIVDSSSSDGTAALAKAYGVEVLIIPQQDFNHGRTREIARKALGTDIVVMMTHDAIAVGQDMITKLVTPIKQGKAVVSYARQVPHLGAKFFESFPRKFNYSAVSELRGVADISREGPQTFFCSDSCCAWLNSALDKVGGFQPTLSLEDTIAAARLVHAGFSIAYCADAIVRHSHHYSLKDEVKRHFDSGYVRAINRDLFFVGGGDERRGTAYAFAMLSALWTEAPQLIPYGLATIAAKLIGYRIGYYGHLLPTWLKRRLSGQPYYWRSQIAHGDREPDEA